MSSIPDADIRSLVRDKYGSLEAARKGALDEDIARLEAGEPLAYVIGWMPFRGLKVGLESRPLIPRPETEWWTTELTEHLRKRHAEKPFTFLDLCAGSGAIGLSILAEFPRAEVSFGEIDAAHADSIRRNIEENHLDMSRAVITRGNLFVPFHEARFDLIATNPPYIPSERSLEDGVTKHEPALALFAGEDGLDLIRTIAREAGSHLNPGGELWMECDIENIEAARELVLEGGAKKTEIRTDQYGRPRVCVGYYP